MIYKKIKKAEKRVIVQYYCCALQLSQLKKKLRGGGREGNTFPVDVLLWMYICHRERRPEQKERSLFFLKSAAACLNERKLALGSLFPSV